ncbi:hypothetical protein ACXGQW_07715 [Wenyingzhuangia sp. IMCC45533]
MKNIYLLLILAVFALPTQGFSQKGKTNTQPKDPITLADAMEIAIRQKTLCQRMAKDKLYIEAKKNKSKADKELDRTIEEFLQGIEVLKTYTPTEDIKLKVAVQEYTFETYKATILKTSKKSMQKIIRTNTLFLNICDDLVRELSNYSKKVNPRLSKRNRYARQQIDNITRISGTISYSTQRLALYYGMNSFEIHEVPAKDLLKIMGTISNALKRLTVSEFNTVEIDDSLSELIYYWSKLRSQMTTRGTKLKITTEDFAETELFEATNTVLDKANEVTRLYAELNKL